MEVTDSSEPSSSPGEHDVDDVLRPEAPLGRDRLDDRHGAFDGELLVLPHEPGLLRQLAVERLDERLAAAQAAAGQQPVLAAALLVAAEKDRAVPSQHGGDADPRLGSHQAPEEPRPPSPRSLGGSSSTSTSSTDGQLDDHELRDAHPGLDDERLGAVGVQEDHLHLAAVARVDEARRVHLAEPVARRQARARHDETGVSGGNRDREPRPDHRACPWRDLDPLAGGEIEPRIGLVRLAGKLRVRAKAPDRDGQPAQVHRPLTRRRRSPPRSPRRGTARTGARRGAGGGRGRGRRRRCPCARRSGRRARRDPRAHGPRRTARGAERRRSGRRTARRYGHGAPRALRRSPPR